MQTKIEVADGRIMIRGPFSEENNVVWRSLAGKFSGGAWVLPDTDTARAKIAELFGEKSDDVTVVLPGSKVGGAQIVQIGGYVLASRRGRDCSVQLADGCSLASGQFSSGGGSMKNPRVGSEAVVYHLTVRRSFAEVNGLEIVTQAAPEAERLSI